MQNINRYTYFFVKSLFHPRWDTNVSPPELLRQLHVTPPGRALDLGCGTGTNVVTMAKYGWDVIGVDYIPMNIYKAKRKAITAKLAERTQFICDSVTKLDGISGTFHLILDIGCYQGLSLDDRQTYLSQLTSLTAPGSVFLLYGMLANPTLDFGLTDLDLAEFQRMFHLENRTDSKDHDRPSTWWKFQKE